MKKNKGNALIIIAIVVVVIIILGIIGYFVYEYLNSEKTYIIMNLLNKMNIQILIHQITREKIQEY